MTGSIPYQPPYIWMSRKSNRGVLAQQADALSVTPTPWPLGYEKINMRLNSPIVSTWP